MKKIFFIFLPFILFSAPLYNGFNQTNLKFNSYFFSDFSYVNDLFFNANYKHFKNKSGKNFVVFFARGSSGYHKNNYNVGVFAQEDYLLLTNKDTAKFVYQLLNHKVLEKDRYNLLIKLKGFETKGIYFNKILSFKKIKFLFGNDLFTISYMQDGKVSGYGIIVNENNYNYYAHANYFYTYNFLYKRKVYYKNGYGYNMHFGIKYEWNDLIFRFIINNLISYIRIKHTPYSNVYLNSQQKHFDKNGYIKYSPLFYGKEYYKDYKGKCDKKYDVYIYKREFFIEYFKWENLILKYFGFQRKIYSVFYEFRNKSFGIAYKNKFIFMKIESDNINYKKAHILGINIGLNFKF